MAEPVTTVLPLQLRGIAGAADFGEIVIGKPPAMLFYSGRAGAMAPGARIGQDRNNSMKTVPAIIIAVALILAPVIWVGLNYLLVSASGESYGASTIDSEARIELERVRQQLEAVQQQMEQLQGQISTLSRTPVTPFTGEDDSGFRPNTGADNEIRDAYAQVVLIANRRNVNKGLQVAGPDYLEAKLGRPRDVLSDRCEAMTNVNLASKLVTEEVGPIRVRMLQPAIDSLKRVFENVERADPDLYARINTAGALCVRRIRGTQNRLSTHSYGLAVDLNIDGRLDTLGDGRTQLGLTILADFFNAEGWVWGAAFGREDSMHFEISRRQLDEWLADGAL